MAHGKLLIERESTTPYGKGKTQLLIKRENQH
jgi:hypothetical protein